MVNIPNLLTALRIAFAPLVLYFILISRQYLASVLFVAIVLSDAFDGYIARKYNQGSRVGKILDPISDKLLYVFVLLGVLIREKYFLWLWFFGILSLMFIVGYTIILRKGIKFPTRLGRICNLAEVILLALMILSVNKVILVLFSSFILVSAFSYAYTLIKK
ncbi:hypothetical protein GF336_04360 [Candidatus Woesearchaeota archaeon]|nr:hypothetical protein [Candidatus Woesearchaeota archaeon]